MKAAWAQSLTADGRKMTGAAAAMKSAAGHIPIQQIAWQQNAHGTVIMIIVMKRTAGAIVMEAIAF